VAGAGAAAAVEEAALQTAAEHGLKKWAVRKM
jgi:hypothetical protein